MGGCSPEIHSRRKGVYWLLLPFELAPVLKHIAKSVLHPLPPTVKVRNV